MRKPDPKFIGASIVIAMASIASATAETRTEYRYPDRPDLVYTSDGQVYKAEDDRPMAFSAYEAAISAEDARRLVGSSEAPQRVAAAPKAVSPRFEPLPAVAAPAPAPAKKAGDFVIQAGAFGSYANAERLSSELASFGATHIAAGEKNGKAIYRVQLGGWSAKNDARPVLNALKASGFDGFVTTAS